MLSILWPLNAAKIESFKGAHIECWHILFTVFMAFVVFKRETVIVQFGFLNSIFFKSLFYIFIANFALGDGTWYATVIGVIFILTAFLNLAKNEDTSIKPVEVENLKVKEARVLVFEHMWTLMMDYKKF